MGFQTYYPPERPNGKPRALGLIDYDTKTYRAFRDDAKGHFCRRHDGYGIQTRIVNDLAARGVERVELEVRLKSGTVQRFVMSVADWLKYGRVDTLRPRDGEQTFMPLRRLLANRVVAFSVTGSASA